MAETTGISWTDATVNFWWGCTRVGPGCDHCYAEAVSRRFDKVERWGTGAPRRKIKSAVALLHRLDNGFAWWAAEHDIGGMHAARRRRVFVQSMADLFDLDVPLEWFREAWATIEACDRIDVQVLTKRVSAVEKRLAAIGRAGWPGHAGLMITVVNQAEADRDVPRLLDLKRRLGIPWVGLSCEPLLGPVDLRSIDVDGDSETDALGGASYKDIWDAHWSPEVTGQPLDECIEAFEDEGGVYPPSDTPSPKIDWVICGGESGPGARPMHPSWARALRDQCAAARVPFFFKQWGAWGWADEALTYAQAEAGAGGRPVQHHSCGRTAIRLGMRRAGRLLDGVIHDGMPAPNRTPAPDDDGAPGDAGGPTPAPRGATAC